MKLSQARAAATSHMSLFKMKLNEYKMPFKIQLHSLTSHMASMEWPRLAGGRPAGQRTRGACPSTTCISLGQRGLFILVWLRG